MLFLELKAGKGLLREKQNEYRLMFLALGHEWYEVRSFKRFLEIVKEGDYEKS